MPDAALTPPEAFREAGLNVVDLPGACPTSYFYYTAMRHPELAAWIQVCQRVSQSENGLPRWEIVGAATEMVGQARREIEACVRRFGASDEYQG